MPLFILQPMNRTRILLKVLAGRECGVEGDQVKRTSPRSNMTAVWCCDMIKLETMSKEPMSEVDVGFKM